MICFFEKKEGVFSSYQALVCHVFLKLEPTTCKINTEICWFELHFCELELKNGYFGLIFEGVKKAKNSHFSLFTFLYFFPRRRKNFPSGGKNFCPADTKKGQSDSDKKTISTSPPCRAPPYR